MYSRIKSSVHLLLSHSVFAARMLRACAGLGMEVRCMEGHGVVNVQRHGVHLFVHLQANRTAAVHAT